MEPNKKPLAQTPPAKPTAAAAPKTPVPPKSAAKPDKAVEIPKNVTHKDMIGREITIQLSGRQEQSFTGHLVALNEFGAVTTGVLRGRKPYIDLVPWGQISFMTCTLGEDDDDDTED